MWKLTLNPKPYTIVHPKPNPNPSRVEVWTLPGFQTGELKRLLYLEGCYYTLLVEAIPQHKTKQRYIAAFEILKEPFRPPAPVFGLAAASRS